MNIWIALAFGGWGMGIWLLAYHKGWKAGFEKSMETPPVDFEDFREDVRKKIKKDLEKREEFKVDF